MTSHLEDLEIRISELEDRNDELEGELNRVQDELSDYEDGPRPEEYTAFVRDLRQLVDTWYRLDLKDAEGNYALHAEALESIVKKYQ